MYNKIKIKDKNTVLSCNFLQLVKNEMTNVIK